MADTGRVTYVPRDTQPPFLVTKATLMSASRISRAGVLHTAEYEVDQAVATAAAQQLEQDDRTHSLVLLRCFTLASEPDVVLSQRQHRPSGRKDKVATVTWPSDVTVTCDGVGLLVSPGEPLCLSISEGKHTVVISYPLGVSSLSYVVDIVLAEKRSPQRVLAALPTAPRTHSLALLQRCISAMTVVSVSDSSQSNSQLLADQAVGNSPQPVAVGNSPLPLAEEAFGNSPYPVAEQAAGSSLQPVAEKAAGSSLQPVAEQNDVMNSSGSDEPHGQLDEQAGIIVSLACPLTRKQMNHPSRGANCAHISAFDALTFLQLNAHSPIWRCPICAKSVPPNLLYRDPILADVLADNTVEQAADPADITLTSTGAWTLLPPRLRHRGRSAAVEIIDLTGIPLDTSSEAEAAWRSVRIKQERADKERMTHRVQHYPQHASVSAPPSASAPTAGRRRKQAVPDWAKRLSAARKAKASAAPVPLVPMAQMLRVVAALPGSEVAVSSRVKIPVVPAPVTAATPATAAAAAAAASAAVPSESRRDIATGPPTTTADKPAVVVPMMFLSRAERMKRQVQGRCRQARSLFHAWLLQLRNPEITEFQMTNRREDMQSVIEQVQRHSPSDLDPLLRELRDMAVVQVSEIPETRRTFVMQRINAIEAWLSDHHTLPDLVAPPSTAAQAAPVMIDVEQGAEVPPVPAPPHPQPMDRVVVVADVENSEPGPCTEPPRKRRRQHPPPPADPDTVIIID